jgi:ribosome biogenesis ATPase
MYKFIKLLFCGIYSIGKNLRIPFFFSFHFKNFSFNQKMNNKKRNFTVFSEKIFFKIFPKIKIQEDKSMETKCVFAEKIFSFQFKKRKKAHFGSKVLQKKFRFINFVGIEEFLPQIREFIILPVINFRLFRETNLETSKGILLNGPPGSGKTLLVHTIAGELNLPIFYLSLQKIFNSLSGVNGKKIQNLFKLASKNSPSILFIDEIENFVPKKESGLRDYEKNLFYQLLFSIDELKKNKNICVIMIAATTSPDQIDNSVSSLVKFDNEIKFKFPTFSTRLKIITDLTPSPPLFFDFDPEFLASTTKNYLSGDLFRLISVCINLSLSRFSRSLMKSSFCEEEEENTKSFITKKDLNRAKILIDPNLSRNGFTDIPNIQWSNIGALEKIKLVLSRYIIEPIKYEHKNLFGYDHGIGLLLYGPPGCGKTLLINAVVRESGANFIFVKGPEILNKFLGESEKGIRKIFLKAKMFDPTIIFFDEFDSVASKRELSQDSPGTSSNDRIVNQLLTEIDSLTREHKIYFIGATNRPSCIDKALLRPGRIDKILPVPYPSLEGKFLILKTILKNIKHIPYLNLSLFMKTLAENLTGADLHLLLKEASVDSGKSLIKYLFVESRNSGLSIICPNLLGTKNFHYGMNKIKSNQKVKTQFL